MMNYLAHAYLSFGHPEIVVGNMISDFIKGKKQYDYPPGIQQGIRLHRSIDQFTDQHLETKKAKLYFKASVGHYSGAFVDVVFDHFLALDTHEMSLLQLSALAKETYVTLNLYKEHLPEIFAKMLPYMESQNWLYNYHNTSGIQKSFEGIVRRAAYLDDSSTAYIAFHQHYEALQACYQSFFPELKAFTIRQLPLLSNQ
jgi:acyl carrier protein phosphodiesterase